MNLTIMSGTPRRTITSRSRDMKYCRPWLSILVMAGFAGLALFILFDKDSALSAAEAHAAVFEPGSESALQEAGESTKFSHRLVAHSRLRCQACHREDNSPRTNWLGHRPCSSCHSQTFAALKGSICTVCHASVEPKTPPVKSLPSLKSFSVKFEHGRHTSVACATCHKAASRGVALSIPTGSNAHATCFQCHGPASTRKESFSCSLCHQPGRFTRPSISAKAFKANFSHGDHTARSKLSCNECHRVSSAVSNTMTHPLTAMHQAAGRSESCQSCHNNQRAFGENFSDCKRCHRGPTFRS